MLLASEINPFTDAKFGGDELGKRQGTENKEVARPLAPVTPARGRCNSAAWVTVSWVNAPDARIGEDFASSVNPRASVSFSPTRRARALACTHGLTHAVFAVASSSFYRSRTPIVVIHSGWDRIIQLCDRRSHEPLRGMLIADLPHYR